MNKSLTNKPFLSTLQIQPSNHYFDIINLQILASGNELLLKQVQEFKESLKKKILKANEELNAHKFEFRVS